MNFYENYELLGLSLLQEAASYRVTQTLAEKHVSIPEKNAQSPCALTRRRSRVTRRRSAGTPHSSPRTCTRTWSTSGR